MSYAKEMSCLCKFIFNNWLSRVASSWKHITRIIMMFKHRLVIWIKSNITLRLQPRSSVNFSEIVDSPALAKQPFVSLVWHQRSHQLLGWANSFSQAAVVLWPRDASFTLQLHVSSLGMRLRAPFQGLLEFSLRSPVVLPKVRCRQCLQQKGLRPPT